jgi:hypothetical protein
MKHEKTFEAIGKLKDVEAEIHRLKNALEMANRTLEAQRQWVGLTDEERVMCRSYDIDETIAKTEAKLKEKNT